MHRSVGDGKSREHFMASMVKIIPVYRLKQRIAVASISRSACGEGALH